MRRDREIQRELSGGPAPGVALRFGPFTFDVRAGELTKRGVRIRLQEQPFQILRILLARPGEIVLREELRCVLWPDDTSVEFDHGINAAIKRLRDALGDSAESPRYIETVARRGYRFVATLEDALHVETAGVAAGEPKPEPPYRRRVAAWAWAVMPAAAIVLTIATALLAYSLLRRHAPDIPRLCFTVEAPEGAAFTSIYGGAAVSPDGTLLAFTAMRSRGSSSTLWIRPTDSLIPRELPKTNGAATAFWSPDSQSIAFFAEGKLKTISMSGAAPRTLCDVAVLTDFDSGAWSREGTLVFSSGGILHRVSAAGGNPSSLTKLEPARGETGHGAPQFLPDGRRLLFVVTSSDPKTAGVYETSLDHPDKRVRIAATPAKTIYIPPRAGRPGYLLWLRERTLIAQPFDADRLRFSGNSLPVAANIAASSNANDAGFWASQSGLVVYRSDSADKSRLAWVARDGTIIEALGKEGAFGLPRISPDGSRVALRDRTDSGNTDVWVYEFKTGTTTRLTFDPSTDTFPVWSPDGRQLTFMCGDRLCRISADGAGALERLPGGVSTRYLWDWSRDGRYLLYAETTLQTKGDLWILPLAPGRSAIPFLSTAFHEFYGQFSPDGNWIAYTSDESGREEVYIRAAFGAGIKRQISNAGGSQPRWRRDGKELFFLTGANLMASRIRIGANAVESDLPHPLFSLSHLSQTFYCYDVAADGHRFLMLLPVGGSAAGALTVVSGW